MNKQNTTKSESKYRHKGLIFQYFYIFNIIFPAKIYLKRLEKYKEHWNVLKSYFNNNILRTFMPGNCEKMRIAEPQNLLVLIKKSVYWSKFCPDMTMSTSYLFRFLWTQLIKLNVNKLIISLKKRLRVKWLCRKKR